MPIWHPEVEPGTAFSDAQQAPEKSQHPKWLFAGFRDDNYTIGPLTRANYGKLVAALKK
jgi:hypothetical protein